MAVVQHLIDFYLSDGHGDASPLSLIRLESRVKEPDAILQKCLRQSQYAWPRYERMEDIAGARVVCPTVDGLDEVERWLTGPRARRNGVLPHPQMVETRLDYVAQPTTGGYRAVHLLMEVQTQMAGVERGVPCEVHLRTVFQDTWASISHASVYRADAKTRSRLRNDLREMGESLEQCEKLAERLLRPLDEPTGI